MWERRPMLGVLIGLTLCVSIWRISSQEPQIIAEYSPYINAYTAIVRNDTTYPPPISLDLLPLQDFSTLIDLDNFQFTINQKSCENMSSPPPHVLVLIHSAPRNWNKRNVIRETWGKDDPRSRIIFLLGAVVSDQLQHKLEQENYLFQDIVQGNFVDAYRNMTYKHVMAFKWFSYYCPGAKYLLKTDDDVFVNTPNMYEVLQDSSTSKRNLLFCDKTENARVSRSYRSKWRVRIKEYPGHYYPTYCPGYSIIYSADTVFTLYREAQQTPYFWIDDVHITGSLAEATGTTITPFGSFFLGRSQRKRIVNGYENATSTFFIFTSPNLTEQDIRTLWKSVTSSSSPR